MVPSNSETQRCTNAPSQNEGTQQLHVFVWENTCCSIDQKQKCFFFCCSCTVRYFTPIPGCEQWLFMCSQIRDRFPRKLSC